ncbi:MAG TPA: potassium-transporting ATPase subunit KdpB [Mycobacterium sp.]|nr:potassium-transporting ATPase subunit KdpB [Mycobacterium sp.]HUH68939.1 potassium-transporting ATPase subunit KdpB [Mycobacterium sp.]
MTTTQTAVPPGRHLGRETRRLRELSILDPGILRKALIDALLKLDPRLMVHKPVMFVVYIGSIWTTLLFVRDAPNSSATDNLFTGLVVLFLWFTVLFANFADAMAEGRGKAHADALRRARQETVAHVLAPDGTVVDTPSTQLKTGDRCVVVAGQAIPGDGEVIDGMAMVDESAITGESAPVVRESGGDRSAVTGGTVVLSDRIVVTITSPPGQTFLDRMIALVEGADRQRTQNELALTVVLVGLTLVFLIAVSTFQLVAIFSGVKQPIVLLVALLVLLSPTTIGALISAIGIAGMDRMIRHNVLAMSGRAVEAAGDVTTLLLDKTGTITFGNRMATEFLPVGGTDEHTLADAAHLSSLADETPEGRSIVEFAQHRYGCQPHDLSGATLVEFSAKTRMSGIDWQGRKVRKGAVGAVSDWVRANGGTVPADTDGIVERITSSGGTPLAVADGTTMLGVIHLKDTVKAGISERLAAMRPFGIHTVMVTGDNPATAAAIAAEAGVDEFIAEATPQQKMERIRAEQAGGDLVAMTGDGTNDAPALALADVGVAMNTGTQAAKEAGNLVDLDSDPTKLMEIVEVGKQLLITRGSLTTFSICNDVAKYFVAIPAMVHAVFPELAAIDILNLHNPHTAILSAVIFNAIIIVLMIPLALRGVRVKAMGATAMLRRNVLIYGVGGLITPFVLIKLIDIAIVAPIGIH